MDPTTRERILELLQIQPNITAAEMSHRLKVTRADIRYHLNALLAQNQIIKMEQTSRHGKRSAGRPANTFQLSPQSRPDILPTLAGILLEIVTSAPDHHEVLGEIASRISPPKLTELTQSSGPMRMNLAITILNKNPYQARWEAHKAGPQVFFHNCPFAAVIREHPELCQVDQTMLTNLTGMRVTQLKWIDFSGPTSPVCQFILVASSQED